MRTAPSPFGKSRRLINQRGVTLMELLVAITLLSLLSVGILFAMRAGLDTMVRSNNRVISNRRVLGVERVLSAQVSGFIPTVADCRPTPEAPITQIGFFQGDVNTMRFVSAYSLQEAHRGSPRILEFQVIPGEEGRGVRLVVNELLYTGPLSTGTLCLGDVVDPLTGSAMTLFRPVQVGPQSFVLADKLAACKFAYKWEREPPEFPLWLDRWPHPFMPSAVRIDMAPLEPDVAQLQVPPFVAPFRPNRNPLIQYAEKMD